jgi:geranylgeranyl pyrophosphate synthase
MNVHNFARWMREGLSSKILEMYAYKTAASVEAAAEMAGVIAGTDRSTHDALVRFARAFGVAFQVQDDVHDFSNSSRWKKTHGEDLALGKPTYVVVRALERLEGRERVRLRQILCSKASRNQPSVLAEGVKLVRKSGALQACGAEASSMLAREWERLSEVLAPSEAKTTLRMLCTGLLDISYEA